MNNLEKYINRIFTIITFLVILCSPFILIEILVYSIRWIVNRKPFPIEPYSFVLLRRMYI